MRPGSWLWLSKVSYTGARRSLSHSIPEAQVSLSAKDSVLPLQPPWAKLRAWQLPEPFAVCSWSDVIKTRPSVPALSARLCSFHLTHFSSFHDLFGSINSVKKVLKWQLTSVVLCKGRGVLCGPFTVQLQSVPESKSINAQM